MNIPNDTITFQTRTAVVWLDEQEIMYAVPRNDSPLELSNSEIVEEIAKFSEFARQRKLPLIIQSDPRELPPPKGQRKIIESHLKKVIKAKAIITDSAFKKNLKNFYYGVTKCDYPIKMFTNVEEAKRWIVRF